MSQLTRNVLMQYWGYSSFRPMQEEIVDSVLAGKDTLALLPTGGGKSICFQVPALATEGVCIVITPIISLMKDQVDHLVKIGIPAAAIYTGMHFSEVDLAYNQAVFGKLKFLYVSPERLQTERFLEAIKKMKVNLLAVDESHCISQWGYDFRPPYLKIADIRRYVPDAPVMALTATATPRVVEDIQYRLGFKKRNVFQTSYVRKNLTYNVIREPDKYGLLYRLLNGMAEGSGIVYVRSRKRTQVIAEWLQSVGITATFYHAGIDAKTRDAKQKEWMDGRTKVMVATNAFGMGIDKPDVRLVVHLDLPDSLEAYFQEAGRAGRDLKPSEAYLLVSEDDIKQLRTNLSNSYPELSKIKLIYNAIGNHLNIPVGAGQGTSYLFDINDFTKRCGFNLMEVFSTLKLLERDGIVALSEALETPSKLMITASREELYRFQVEYKEFDNIISYLLRNVPGILSDFVAVREEKIAKDLGFEMNILEHTIRKLERYNFLKYVPRNDRPQIQFVTERLSTGHFSLTDEVYKNRKKDAEYRVQAVIDFVTNAEECRSVQLLRYFGEKSKAKCGKCDVCSSRNKMTVTDLEYKDISGKIIGELRKGVVSLKALPFLTNGFREEKVLETVRWMIDNSIVEKDESGDDVILRLRL